MQGMCGGRALFLRYYRRCCTSNLLGAFEVSSGRRGGFSVVNAGLPGTAAVLRRQAFR